MYATRRTTRSSRGDSWWSSRLLPTAPPRRRRSTRPRGVKKGYVKPCTPIGGDLDPSIVPADVDDMSTGGCFGWNPPERSAVCVTGRGSMNGMELKVEEIGGTGSFDWKADEASWPNAKASAATIAKARELLTKGKYTTLAGHRTRTLEIGDEASWAKPKLAIRYSRPVTRPEVHSGEGSWSDVTERVELTCGHQKRALFEHDIQGSTGGTVTIDYAPTERWALVQWTYSWAYEGEYGSATEVVTLELDKEDCS